MCEQTKFEVDAGPRSTIDKVERVFLVGFVFVIGLEGPVVAVFVV